MRVTEGLVSTPQRDSSPFVRPLSLYSPKIGRTSFVITHERLLNLLWRDLDVNLFPVEKAKLWKHKPKNKTLGRFRKAFYAHGCAVMS